MRFKENLIDFYDRQNFLRCFSEFDYNEKNDNFTFSFNLKSQELEFLKKQHKYTVLVDKSSEFRSMVSLMVWVNDILIGDGMAIPPKEFDALHVLNETVTSKLRCNCYMYAVVLNEIFLSVGYISRMVRCLPIDLDFNDCHCVTEAYCQELNKWIIFDSANRAYYINKEMIPLNLFELREHIKNNKKVYVPYMGRTKSAALIEYLSKNLIRFESFKHSMYGNERFNSKQCLLHFQSRNYPISDKTINYPDVGTQITHIHTSNPNLFWAKPDPNDIII